LPVRFHPHTRADDRAHPYSDLHAHDGAYVDSDSYSDTGTTDSDADAVPDANPHTEEGESEVDGAEPSASPRTLRDQERELIAR